MVEAVLLKLNGEGTQRAGAHPEPDAVSTAEGHDLRALALDAHLGAEAERRVDQREPRDGDVRPQHVTAQLGHRQRDDGEAQGESEQDDERGARNEHQTTVFGTGASFKICSMTSSVRMPSSSA